MRSESSAVLAQTAESAISACRLHVAIAYWDPYTTGGVQTQVAGRLNTLGARNGAVRYTLFAKQRSPGESPWPHIRTVRFSGWDRGSIAIAEYTAAHVLVRRLEEVHRDDPIDLVEMHASGFGPAVACWARRKRIPSLYVSHSLHCFEHGSSGIRWDALWYYAWANRRTAKECSRILAVSHALKEQWLQHGVPAEQVEVQHTATDDWGSAPPGPCVENGPTELLFVGRISPEKGLDVLIDAVDQCARVEGPNIHLTVVGTIPTNHSLVRKVAERRLPVTFAGGRPNPTARRMMAQADAVVIPSRHDYCPLVAIEALQAGALVVASRVGGLPELIRDQETGFLVPANDVAALASVLCRIVRDRTAWTSLRQAARLAGGRFTWSARAPQILDLYRRLVNRGA